MKGNDSIVSPDLQEEFKSMGSCKEAIVKKHEIFGCCFGNFGAGGLISSMINQCACPELHPQTQGYVLSFSFSLKYNF